MILTEDSRGPGVCPGCGGDDFVRYGRTAKGTQRFRCNACGMTFVPKGPAVGSQLTEEQWLVYAGCHAAGKSARESAELCGVSVGTVYRMRDRIDELIERRGDGRKAASARFRPSC